MTQFIAQLWGPILIAVSIGIFFSRSYYNKIYRDIEKEPLALLTFGIFGMALGIIHVLAHNAWGNFAQGLVSLLGWLLLIKSVAFVVAPKFVEESGAWTLKAKLLPFSRILILAVGLYLSWIGYFA